MNEEEKKIEFTTIYDAFEAGKKIGFINGFLKASSIIVDNIQKMQEKIINASKGGKQ